MSLDITQHRIGQSLFKSGIFLLKHFVDIFLGHTRRKLVAALICKVPESLLRNLDDIGGFVIIDIDL